MGQKDRMLDREKRSNSTSAKPTGKVAFADRRFVRLDLTSDEKAEFKALLAAGEFDNVSPDHFLANGYELKYTVQDQGKTVCCTVSSLDGNDVNAGLMLTGRGNSSTVALCVLYYKDVYLCDDGMWAAGEASRRDAGLDIG